MHVLPNYMYIYLIMRWKICLEMELIRPLPNYVYIYLFICLPNYMCVFLIKKWKICLEMEQVCLPIFYLIRRWTVWRFLDFQHM